MISPETWSLHTPSCTQTHNLSIYTQSQWDNTKEKSLHIHPPLYHLPPDTFPDPPLLFVLILPLLLSSGEGESLVHVALPHTVAAPLVLDSLFSFSFSWLSSFPSSCYSEEALAVAPRSTPPSLVELISSQLHDLLCSINTRMHTHRRAREASDAALSLSLWSYHLKPSTARLPPPPFPLSPPADSRPAASDTSVHPLFSPSFPLVLHLPPALQPSPASDVK